MKLQLLSFASIFELFATFTLAYILIDELTRRNFVSLVTERVMRSYQSIEKIFDEVNGEVALHKTNLQRLTQQGRSAHSTSVSEHKRKLKVIQTESNRDYKDIRVCIGSNYNNSNLFSYLSCYLFLYCLGILFVGGIYESDDSLEFMCKLDLSVSLIFVLSLIYLIGWFFNKKRVGTPGFMSQVYGLCNGYFVSVFCFVLVMLSALIISRFATSIRFPWSLLLHNILVILCILLPVSNFIVYIIKAYRRVQLTRPVLIERAKLSKDRSIKQLEEIREFVSHCKYSNRLQLATNGSNVGSVH